ncbi:MAG: hypothetical protein RIC84_04735 [Aggregatilineales bacterium]
MAADFKSHILLRDEKGFFGVPFKRLLLAGVGGGFTYTLTNLTLANWSVPIAFVVTIATIVLTSPRGGIPLWRRLIYRLRGLLLLTASRFPQSPIAQVVDLLDLPVDLVQLDGAWLFAPPSHDVEIDLREWITFAHARETDGLVFVDAPLTGGTHER